MRLGSLDTRKLAVNENWSYWEACFQKIMDSKFLNDWAE